MNLTPREKDKLLVATAAMVARRRLERGVKLNHPEAIALIADFVVEGARDGRSVADLMRDGMGQSQKGRAEGAVDTVITNALIVDHWGIVKADIGLKDGRIAAIGKAGNPDIQPGVTIVIG